MWLAFSLSSQATFNAGLLEVEYGYAPVAKFHLHPNPPKIDSELYKQLVWRYPSVRVFWLPFWGRKSGEYGLYRAVNAPRAGIYLFTRHPKRAADFVPLTFGEAEKLAATVNVRITPEPPISTWSLYFGWVVLLPFSLILWWNPRFYFRQLD